VNFPKNVFFPKNPNPMPVPEESNASHEAY